MSTRTDVRGARRSPGHGERDVQRGAGDERFVGVQPVLTQVPTEEPPLNKRHLNAGDRRRRNASERKRFFRRREGSVRQHRAVNPAPVTGPILRLPG